MFMEKIRNAGKNHRKIMIAVVACLCLALVIGFASMGASAPGANQGADIETQIAYYEEYAADLISDGIKDNTTNGQLGGTYQTLADLYSQAGQVDKATEATKTSNMYYIAYYEALVTEQRNAGGDSKTLLAGYLDYLSSYYSADGQTEKAEAAETEALGYYETIFGDYIKTAKESAEKTPTDASLQRSVGYYVTSLANVKDRQDKADEAKALYAEAAGYYNKAVTLLAADADANTRGQYIVDEAACREAAGEAEAADKLYEEAIKLAPSNINVVQPYFSHVLATDGLDAAYALIPTYQPYFTEEGDAKNTFDGLAAYITLYYQLVHSATDNTTATDEEKTTTTAE